MSKTAVVTDSTAYIPDDLCKNLNITVVPLNVIWGEKHIPTESRSSRRTF